MKTNYRTLFNDFLDGILIINESDFTIVETNPAVTRISGYRRETLIGRPLFTIFDDDEQSDDSFNMQNYVVQARRCLHADGKTELYLDMTISRISDDVREQLVVVIRDVTGQKLSFDRIKEINRVYIKSSSPQTFLFRSNTMKELYKTTLKLHHDRDTPVLIQGETGTGKEVIARMLHFGRDNSYQAPYIPINCAAIPPELFESELFGYEGGAFTGSSKKGRLGKFELAKGGTIFLDEIGEMPLNMQPKLLRVLQEREFYRIGGSKSVKVELRIVAATNRNLEEQVREGSFRQDLFYRINVAQLILPPLRERKEDISPLANHFLREQSHKKKRRFKTFSQTAMERLLAYNWPGNIRELQNVIERLVLLNDDTIVRADHLGSLTLPATSALHPPIEELNSFQLPDASFDLKAFERRIVKEALNKFDGNKTRTAQYLGLTRSALRSRLDE